MYPGYPLKRAYKVQTKDDDDGLTFQINLGSKT